MGLGESPQGDQMEDLPVKNGGLSWFNDGKP